MQVICDVEEGRRLLEPSRALVELPPTRRVTIRAVRVPERNIAMRIAVARQTEGPATPLSSVLLIPEYRQRTSVRGALIHPTNTAASGPSQLLRTSQVPVPGIALPGGVQSPEERDDLIELALLVRLGGRLPVGAAATATPRRR